MSQRAIEISTDDQITTRVLDILRNAKKHVTLVSPYNKFWMHIKNAIRSAVGSGVRVDFIFRSDQRNEDIDWLEREGVKVHAVENLHAKIYLNESSVLVTSMNLLESSSKNSMEICISVNDQEAQKEVRGYVSSLKRIAQTAEKGKKVSPRPATSRAKTRKNQTVSKSPSKYKAGAAKPSFGGLQKDFVAAVTNGVGRCIRCDRSIPLDPGRPLCGDCFDTWSQYGDPDYEEDYCHRCGADWDTSYAKPLCRPCYDQVVA